MGRKGQYSADNPVERAFLEVANHQAAPGNAARHLAQLLRTPEFDWRDLARAFGRLQEEAARSSDPEAESSATAARVALVAMRRTMGAGSHEGDARARLRVQEACDPRAAPEKMLSDVFAVLHEIVDFDIATFVEYHGGDEHHEKTLVRGRFAMDGAKVFTWPARWVEIDPTLVAWMKGDDRRIENLKKFYKTEAGAKALECNPVAQEYRKRGAHSAVSVARIDGGRLRGAVSLARRKDKLPFRPDEQDRLNWLGLDRVMRLASSAFQARQQSLALRVAELFDVAGNADPLSTARELVELIGKGFGWEYVAIFRVARVREQFEVVAQYDAAGGKLSVRDGYTQPLEGRKSGMLGHARRERTTLRIPDVRPPRPRPKGWRPPYDYIRTNRAQTSAMCVPLCLDGEVEWVLDCESKQVNAFLQPDEDAIVALVRDIERTIRLWFESRLNKALLN
jgi:hypothetical protein